MEYLQIIDKTHMLMNLVTKEVLNGSWKILKTNKKLLLPPIVAVFITLFLFVVFVIFLFSVFDDKQKNLETILFLSMIFLGLIFIVLSLFRGVLIYCIGKILMNQKLSLKEGLYAARKKFFEIVKWSITDSALLSIAAPAWRLLNIFVVPLIVLENLSIKQAIGKSYQLFTKTWRTATIFDFSLDLLFLIVGLGGVFLLPIMVIAFSPILLDFISADFIVALLILFYILFTLTLMILGLLAATLREIFIVALYYYAVFGKIPSKFFSKKILMEAFK